MTSGANPLAVGQSVLKPDRPVGIAGYGAYVPQFRLPASEVARVWTGGIGGVPIKEKAVAGLDEDVITMAIEAAQNALARAGIDPRLIRAVWVGSESHPYAVKPSSTIVAESIGAPPTSRRRLEFASSRVRGDAGRIGFVAAHGPVRAGDWYGHRAGPPRRRARIHGGGGRRGLPAWPAAESLA